MPKKSKRKNAVPESYEEALWGAQVDPDMLDLALRLEDGLSYEEGTAKHQEAMACFNSEVLTLMIDDIQAPSVNEGGFKRFADAFELVISVKAHQSRPWSKTRAVDFPAKKKYFVAFKIKLELAEGSREQPPTLDEFVQMLEQAGCFDLNSANAGKLAKEAGWTPTKTKRGPKPRQKSK